MTVYCRTLLQANSPSLEALPWTQQRIACPLFPRFIFLSYFQVRRLPLPSATSCATITSKDAAKFAALADIAPVESTETCSCVQLLQASRCSHRARCGGTNRCQQTVRACLTQPLTVPFTIVVDY